MTKLLMNDFKIISVHKGVWYNTSTEWNYARDINLWDIVIEKDEFKDLLAKVFKRK